LADNGGSGHGSAPAAVPAAGLIVRTVVTTVVALFVGVGLGVLVLWTPGMGDLDYVEGSAAGLRRAKAEGKPALYYFSARWCGACRQMSGSVFRDDATVAALSAFVPVLVDADSEPEFAERYGLRLLPSIVFADAEGEPLVTVHGSRSVDDFRKLVLEAREKAAAAD
jgi:thiol:disulfide interchange protein